MLRPLLGCSISVQCALDLLGKNVLPACVVVILTSPNTHIERKTSAALSNLMQLLKKFESAAILPFDVSVWRSQNYYYHNAAKRFSRAGRARHCKEMLQPRSGRSICSSGPEPGNESPTIQLSGVSVQLRLQSHVDLSTDPRAVKVFVSRLVLTQITQTLPLRYDSSVLANFSLRHDCWKIALAIDCFKVVLRSNLIEVFA